MTTFDRPPLSIWHYWWVIVRRYPHIYLGALATRFIVFTAAVQIFGLIRRNYFDALTDDALFGWSAWTWATALIVVYLVHLGLSLVNQYLHILWGIVITTLLRTNLFRHILDQPGAQALPASTGEAVSRFRGDADYVAAFMRWTIQIVANVSLVAIAFVIMLGINVRITLLVFLPLMLITTLARLMMTRAERYRQASRNATGSVTGFIGEMFGAVQSVKAATSEDQMLTHFRDLNHERQHAALREKLFTSLLNSFSGSIGNLGIGVILLVAAGAMVTGAFTIGDFALFVFYLGYVMTLVASIGMATVQLKQTSVSFARMDRLLQDAPQETLVRKTDIHLRGPLPAVPFIRKTTEHRLETLTVDGLTYCYPGTAAGIHNIKLNLPRGSFTVITGRIGSGKTTLIRTLLGLVPCTAGNVLWNDVSVQEPATFIVPPHVAYTPQVPILFSDTVRDNILLGLPERQVDLPSALHAAILEPDVNQLERGLDTVIGPRGVKLSGGQQQRTAAARMFVRDAELLIFDDLSSALDANTEQALWERLFARAETTCLVVSHRRAALQRADHIIVLKDGRIADEGRLAGLLVRGEEMKDLYNNERS